MLCRHDRRINECKRCRPIDYASGYASSNENYGPNHRDDPTIAYAGTHQNLSLHRYGEPTLYERPPLDDRHYASHVPPRPRQETLQSIEAAESAFQARPLDSNAYYGDLNIPSSPSTRPTTQQNLRLSEYGTSSFEVTPTRTGPFSWNQPLPHSSQQDLTQQPDQDQWSTQGSLGAQTDRDVAQVPYGQDTQYSRTSEPASYYGYPIDSAHYPENHTQRYASDDTMEGPVSNKSKHRSSKSRGTHR